MTLCATRLRPPSELGPAPLVRLAADAGFAGMAIDGGCFLRDLPGLAAEGLKVGLELGLVFAPVAVEPLAQTKRLPYLAAWNDKEEQLEARRLVLKNLEVARQAGAKRAVIDFGMIELKGDEHDVRQAYAEAALGRGDDGRYILDRALAHRKPLSSKLMDAYRAGLEPLLRYADSAGLTLLLMPAPTPWHAVSSLEIGLLQREFLGAPLSVLFAPAARSVLKALTLAGPDERWDELAKNTSASYATDTVGLARDLLPGLGELWLPFNNPPTLPDGPVVISGRRDSSLEEVIAARALIQSRRALSAPTAPTEAESAAL